MYARKLNFIERLILRMMMPNLKKYKRKIEGLK